MKETPKPEQWWKSKATGISFYVRTITHYSVDRDPTEAFVEGFYEKSRKDLEFRLDRFQQNFEKEEDQPQPTTQNESKNREVQKDMPGTQGSVS